ncbi:MAG: thermonuclease family protein [Alphaproteobacteria bacterium]
MEPFSNRETSGRRKTALGRCRTAALLVVLAAFLSAPSARSGPEVVPGPVPAEVVSVVDGDTIVVRAKIWLGQQVETRVRMAGVDAPELKGRCPRERELAAAARDLVQTKIGGAKVWLRDVRYDKYGSRVLARVEDESGEDLASVLSRAGLARPYDGGARQPWCATASSR